MNIVEYITDEAKVLILNKFIEQNQVNIESLVQTKHQYHFFSRFIRLKYRMDEKECNRLSILASYLHTNLHIKKSKIMIQFAKDSLIDFTFNELKNASLLDSIIDTAIPVHISIDKQGDSKILSIH